MLRKENEALANQIALQKRVFREVNLALGALGDVAIARLIPNEFIAKANEEEANSNATVKISTLSEREKEVLKLIVNGLTSKEIADELGISKLTVDTHRKHIQQKLGVSKQVDILKLAMKSGIA
ncbi:MAG: helix-turn-helix transcriptional regulator [Saprospiraceae bacterium]|nr:helix-turn-helix transcriptional regulator [Saprospiraceae bacterium]